MPPELMAAYVRKSGLVQVGENTYLQTGQKWGLDEGQQYASNEDIMDYLAGPTKVAPR